VGGGAAPRFEGSGTLHHGPSHSGRASL